MHSLLIITKEEYFKLNLVLNASASAFATAEAVPLAHQRETTVSYRPHQPSTFYIVT